MKAVIQRVTRAEVRVDGEVVGAIDRGLLVLLGVAEGDEEAEARRLAGKIAKLRIFPSERHPIDSSLLDVEGAALVVSQFTLCADTRKGHRPSFTSAARSFCAVCVTWSHSASGPRSRTAAANAGSRSISWLRKGLLPNTASRTARPA